MNFMKLFFYLILILISINIVNLLECYVCKDQEDNKDKCIETVKTCVNAEDRCLTIVKWGSTPYWVPSGDKQYYISKRCSSKQNCELLNANLSQKCDAIWYNDWECAECCHGDRCNYYVTLDSSKIRSNQCLIFFLFILYLIIIYSIA